MYNLRIIIPKLKRNIIVWNNRAVTVTAEQNVTVYKHWAAEVLKSRALQRNFH